MNEPFPIKLILSDGTELDIEPESEEENELEYIDKRMSHSVNHRARGRSAKSHSKWRTKYKGKYYRHGDRHYTIAPGTKRGDAYCARSYGIMKKYGKTPKNTLSRRKWKCRGKKSIKSEIQNPSNAYMGTVIQ